MANCTTCFDNCDPIVTDKCSKYTGPNIDELGICKGMTLFAVNKIILDKLQIIATSEEIKLEEIETCSIIVDLLEEEEDQPFTLQQFAEIVFKGICLLDSKITTVINSTPPFSFTTSCLTGDVSSRDKIIQALITKVCSLSTSTSTIETTYVKQTDLCSLVQACNISTPPPTVSNNYYTRMVPYAPIPYIGSASNFDNTGKGLASAGFDKIYLMNGLNNTQDWRGRSPIGAIQNVPGAALDVDVDPTIAANLSYNYAAGSKYGKSSVALTASQMPQHNHTLTDNGHDHGISSTNSVPSSSANVPPVRGSQAGTENGTRTSKVSSGVSIASAGGNQAHTNLHPVIGTLFIVYIP